MIYTAIKYAKITIILSSLIFLMGVISYKKAQGANDKLIEYLIDNKIKLNKSNIIKYKY